MSKGVHPTQKTGRKPGAKTSSKSSFLAKVPIKRFITWLRGLDRNIQLAGSLGIILLIVGVISITSSESQSTVIDNNEQTNDLQLQVEPKTSAVLTRIDGTLQTKDEAGDWADIDPDAQLEEGASLRTVGASSRAVVTFTNNSQLRLDANSEVEIESLTDERIVVQHRAGYTYNRVVQSDLTYVVKSTDAQYEALGTAFRTSATGDEQAVEVFHSSVIETQTNKRTVEGKKYTVKSNVNPSRDGTFDDLDIESLKKDRFIEWNIAIDSENDLYKDDLGFLGDTEGPELSVTSHQPGELILLEPTASEGVIEIAGTTERKTTVIVKNTTDEDGADITVVSGDDGKFITPVIQTSIGDVIFEITARDKAGNETTVSLRVGFQKKSAPITSNQGITLSASTDDTNTSATVTWVDQTNIVATDGYILLVAKQQTPIYDDGSTLGFFPSGDSSMSIIGIDNFEQDTDYHFTVCVYDAVNDTCLANTVSNEFIYIANPSS